MIVSLLSSVNLTDPTAMPEYGKQLRKRLPVRAESCDDSPIATDTTHSRISFRDEHIDSRKDWCTYIFLKTTVNRGTVKQTDEFIAQIQARLDRAKRRA